MQTTHEFENTASRAFTRNDMWVGPCPILAALEADDELAMAVENGWTVKMNPGQLERGWQTARDAKLQARFIFAWNLQLDFDPRAHILFGRS